MTKTHEGSKGRNDIEKKLKNEKKKSEEYLNQYKYLKADFENYKKIVERDKKNTIEIANQQLIERMLPLIDDIENAIEKTKDKKHKEGLQMIFNNFMKVLIDSGLKPIECIGKKFDPYYHEVLIKEESDKEDGVIIKEIQKGYMLNNKVIRHSKVKISKKR